MTSTHVDAGLEQVFGSSVKKLADSNGVTDLGALVVVFDAASFVDGGATNGEGSGGVVVVSGISSRIVVGGGKATVVVSGGKIVGSEGTANG